MPSPGQPGGQEQAIPQPVSEREVQGPEQARQTSRQKAWHRIGQAARNLLPDRWGQRAKRAQESGQSGMAALAGETTRVAQSITPSEEAAPILTVWEKHVSDLINFYKTLPLLEQFGVVPRSGQQTTVIALGSGRFTEGYALEAYLGGIRLNTHTSNVDLTAIDIDQDTIAEAKAVHTVIDPDNPARRMPLPNYHYAVGDATNLASIPGIPQSADVVFIGHQRISQELRAGEASRSDAVRRGTWREIVAGGLLRLRDDNSRMIITSYNEGEHQDMLKAIEGLDCEIVVSDFENPNTRPAVDGEPSSLAAVHGRIAVLKRKPRQKY